MIMVKVVSPLEESGIICIIVHFTPHKTLVRKKKEGRKGRGGRMDGRKEGKMERRGRNKDGKKRR